MVIMITLKKQELKKGHLRGQQIVSMYRRTPCSRWKSPTTAPLLERCEKIWKQNLFTRTEKWLYWEGTLELAKRRPTPSMQTWWGKGQWEFGTSFGRNTQISSYDADSNRPKGRCWWLISDEDDSDDDEDSHLQQPALSRLNVLNWELALQRKKLQKQTEFLCKVGKYKRNQNPRARWEITKAIRIWNCTDPFPYI